jgi:photosystem II stability/assembly factor-like uncharacterized protein
VLVLLLALTACTSGNAPRATAPSASPAPSATPTAAASPTPEVDDSSPNPEASYRPLAATEPLTGFVPTSVSFVSTRTGWFLGTRPCGSETCGVLLQTRDGGRSFGRRTAPPVQVGQVRFADLQQGWAFGAPGFGDRPNPGLWRTHDGGRSWRRISTHSVPSLEIGSGNVWAIDTGEDGTVPDLVRGDATADALKPVFRAPNRAATVVVGHGTAYVAAQSLAGPIATTLWAVTHNGAQQRRNPCTSDEARALQVAVGQAQHLVAVCSGEGSAGGQLKRAFASADDGRSWQRLPDPPADGYTGVVGNLAATSTSAFLTGSRNGINKETGSGSWRRVLLDDDGTGFSFVGFTDDTHGVALGRRAGWMTTDAGEHWRRLQFR